MDVDRARSCITRMEPAMLDDVLHSNSPVIIDTVHVPSLFPIFLYLLQRLRASGLFEEMCPIWGSSSGNGSRCKFVDNIQVLPSDVYSTFGAGRLAFSVKSEILRSRRSFLFISSGHVTVRTNEQSLYLHSDCTNQSTRICLDLST